MVREAVFDILASLEDIEDAAVLDLFCGSGALGLEALSRGAGSVTFVDRDQRALRAVEANLAHVGLEGETVSVVRATLPGWLSTAGPAGRSDLVLCDPPYGFDQWPRLLDSLPPALAVLESDRPLPLSERWAVARSRRYGGTLITVAQRRSSPSSGPASSPAQVEGP